MTAPTKPLPAPLVPADVNLQHYPAMPLKLQRLHDSRTWRACRRRPELGFYHVNLWAKAYHQVPAGSLNNDDDELVDFARCDASVWPTVRADLMRGWVLCSDGRLYHPVVAEVALESWLNTLDHRTRAAKMRRQRAVKNTADLPAADVAKLVKEIDAELAAYDRQAADAKARLAKLKAANESDEISPVGLVALATTERDDTVASRPPLVNEPRDGTTAECDVTKPLNGGEGNGGDWRGLRSSIPAPPSSETRGRVAGGGTQPEVSEGKSKPEPDRPTFHAEKTAATARTAADVGPKVLEAAGIDPTRWMGTWAAIEGWLRAGYDLDADILPAIAGVAARPGYVVPASLNYFTQAIVRHRKARADAGAIPAATTAPGPTDATARWPQWVRLAARSLTQAQAERSWGRWRRGRDLDEHVGIAVVALGMVGGKAVLEACPALRTDRLLVAYEAIGRRIKAGEDCSSEAKPEGVRA